MRTLSSKLPLLGLFALLLVTTVAPVEAGFSLSYYDVTNWTTTMTPGTSDASVDTSLAPASVTLIGADNEVGPSNLDFTVAAHSNGTVSFNWDYSVLRYLGCILGSVRLLGEWRVHAAHRQRGLLVAIRRRVVPREQRRRLRIPAGVGGQHLRPGSHHRERLQRSGARTDDARAARARLAGRRSAAAQSTAIAVDAG